MSAKKKKKKSNVTKKDNIIKLLEFIKQEQKKDGDKPT